MIINSILSTGESRVVLSVEAAGRAAVAVVEGDTTHLYPKPGKHLHVHGERVACGGSGLVPATLKVLSVAEEAAFWASPRR